MTAARHHGLDGVPSLLYLIKQVELAARSYLDELVAPYGISALQYTALSVLARNPGMTSARLARNSFVRIQSMAQTIAILEAHDYISREPDPASRRQLLISLTPQGWDRVHDVQPRLDAFERDMLEDFEPEEVARMVDALRRLRLRLAGSHPN